MIRRMLLVCSLVLAALSFSCGGGAGDAGPHVWERFEVTLPVESAVDNPFDPAQLAVDAEFESPSGEVYRVPAFVLREYHRELVDGKETLAPDGPLVWRVRFTPAEPGTWRWRWSLNSGGKVETHDWQSLEVALAREGRHGLLRVSPDDRRYLRFDDGTPYFAVGENLAWYDDRGTFAYDDWFAKLAERGANYVRLWMPSWAFGLEWTEPENTLGTYTARLDRAWQLDYVLEQAERHGIYVVLCIQNHGPFSLSANSEWEKNPYNAANGGPLAEPREFFTNAEAEELFKRRLRYIVVRWGYAPNILAWELWNEVDLVDGASLDGVVAWHDEMSHELRALDPYDHLISTSTSLPWSVAAFQASDIRAIDSPLLRFWELPAIDYSQVHMYSLAGAALDFSALLPEISDNLRRFEKPVLLAEAGVDFRGPAETLEADRGGVGFHDMLWAGLFSQTMGTGMSWWWDNVVDPQDWYFHFSPLAALVDGVAFDREGFRAGGATASAGARALRAQALIGNQTALVWVKNPAHQWFSPDRSDIAGAMLRLEGVAPGTWRATWRNTYSGDVLQERDLDVSGPLELTVPEFSRDIALRLDRR